MSQLDKSEKDQIDRLMLQVEYAYAKAGYMPAPKEVADRALQMYVQLVAVYMRASKGDEG